MSKPIRIQRKRTKGWRMPENTISVARPSPYGNQHHVGPCPTCHGVHGAEEAVRIYIEIMEVNYQRDLDEHTGFIKRFLEPLRGKNLACWCNLSEPCHADILLELANKEAA